MPSSNETNRVLVVDDDPDVREALQLVLERRGFEVRLAGDGQQALEALDREIPSLVLLDLMMPVMSGPELLERMRAIPRFAEIPVLLVTAWPREAASLPDAQGVVEKPVDIRKLFSTIARAIA